MSTEPVTLNGTPLDDPRTAALRLMLDLEVPMSRYEYAQLALAIDTNGKVTEIRDALVPVLTGLAPYAEDPSKLLGMLPEPLRTMFGL